MIENKTLFLTGGAGFIGTALIGRLAERNKVVVLDNLARNSLKDTKYARHPNIEVREGDVVDLESVRKAYPPEADIVVNLAAVAGIDTVIKNPVRTMEVNMIGEYNVLRTIRDIGRSERLERFLGFSTSEVFGISAFRVDEQSTTNMQPVGEARWTYAVSKLAAEHLAHAFHKQHGMRSVTVRPFNVYGPGQIGEGAIHHFVLRAVKGEALQIHGKGDQIRSWCYIDDMVDGILLCLEKDDAIGEVFNIGNPRGTITILGLAEKVVDLAASKSKIQHVAKNYVDVELRIPNIDKARNLLKFEPKIDLNEGIARTVAWYRQKLHKGVA